MSLPPLLRYVRPALLTITAAVVGLILLWGEATSTSATYDETTYIDAAVRWRRQGDSEGVTRMGSPNLFWKLQLAPTFALLDLVGRGDLIDDQPKRQPELLPIARLGAFWIWLAGLAIVAWWARRIHGPWAMAFAAWLYALSPNLLAHGALLTMETPVTVATAATFLAFWTFLSSGRRRWFAVSALLCGLAFACKFTAIVYPPILALAWWLNGLTWTETWKERTRRTGRIAGAMAAYTAILLASDFLANGGARLPLSPATGDHPSASSWFGPLGPLVGRLYETPIPQDWVGFAGQLRHQASGGPGYLLGERRLGGWRHYYLVALAVKVPLVFWLMAAWRWRLGGLRESLTREPDRMLLTSALLFIAIASAGSSRNYGVRYLLPTAPLAIVWLARLARRDSEESSRSRRIRVAVATVGLVGQAIAVGGIHPNEITYFNAIAGGPEGGRKLLADSNLDWGQGLRALVRLQQERPELRDLTLYYFGDVDPSYYGVAGAIHVVDAEGDRPVPPPLTTVATPYVAVSVSLQYGPWGPTDHFRSLDDETPIATANDATILIYGTPTRPTPRQ